MRTTRAILILALASMLAGCALKGKQQTAKNIPPPPQPVPKTEPAPPPEHLSIPQTQVELPPPQPVSPEALAAAQLPGEPAEPPSVPARSTGGGRRPPTGPPPIAPPKPEQAIAPPATTAPAESNTPIQEIVPPGEQKHLQEVADARKREIRQWLEQANARRLTRHELSLKKTIESYLKLSDQAEMKGDMRQASEVAERAWVLAKDLQGGR